MKESDFRFLGYHIAEIHFNLEDEYFSEGKGTIDPKIEIVRKFQPDKNRFVQVILKIILETKNKSFLFRLVIKGSFQANENMSDSLFERMSLQNAPAILYPFARSIITSYTAQANIKPIILPSVNFSAPEQS